MAFRVLGRRDALFLVGVISQMRTSADLEKPGNLLGSFIVVVSGDDEVPLSPPPARP